MGRRMDTAVHFKLPVSFFMVRQVVEQGQWNREKTAMQTAVLTVHPLADSRLKMAVLSSMGARTPLCK